MSRAAGTNGRYWPLAEIRDARQNVRFRGQSGHPLGLNECLLMTHRDVLQCHAMSVAIGGIADIGRQPGLDRLVANE